MTTFFKKQIRSKSTKQERAVQIPALNNQGLTAAKR